MRRVLAGLLVGAVVAIAGAAAAQAPMGAHTVSVTITNRTQHQTFAAPVVVAHSAAYRPFALGEPVLPELIPLAEDGMTRDFETVARVLPAVLDYRVADGPLAPGESVTLQLRVDDAHPLLSAFGMLVTTNDAVFDYGTDLSMRGKPTGSAASMGSSSAMTSSGSMGTSDAMAASDAMGTSDPMGASAPMGAARGTAAAMTDPIDLYDGTVRVLDAGTEANTESCHDVPGPPCGSVGARHPAMAEGTVTLHRGLSGSGDLDKAVYGWQDPVAVITISTP